MSENKNGLSDDFFRKPPRGTGAQKTKLALLCDDSSGVMIPGILVYAPQIRLTLVEGEGVIFWQDGEVAAVNPESSTRIPPGVKVIEEEFWQILVDGVTKHENIRSDAEETAHEHASNSESETPAAPHEPIIGPHSRRRR